MALPEFVAPMLATLVEAPFDSEEHLFEVKWDGIRALTFVEDGSFRALTRNRQDLALAFPELELLRGLPSGTALDGELVVFEGESPSFSRALERMHVRQRARAEAQARALPAVYVVFDLLYADGKSCLKEPLTTRRARLEELVGARADARLVFSEGLTGAGRAFFEQMRARSLEGCVAKELASTYQAGKRTRSWLKIKTTQTMPCLILGWVADARGDLTSLVIAAEQDGRLVSVGRVGSGLTDALRARLRTLCDARRRAEPYVETDEAGSWVEPGLYCTVSYLERTKNGLRAPVFVELLEER
jgi:bifunctional non-homologous end joining protein LigD